MNYDIRYGVMSDLGFIMSLEKDSLALPWPEESIVHLLEENDTGNAFSFAAVCPSVGYVGVTGVLDEAEIGNLVVSPECRGQGAGYAIMSFALSELDKRGIKTIYLEVESVNDPALSLYRKLGFAEYGRRDSYYGAGRDAVLMKLVTAC